MADMDDLETELEASNDNEWDDARFQRRMDNVANASANIGSLLLQGWTMLADQCDKCHSPLMSQRGSQPQCVVCKPANKSAQKLKPKSVKSPLSDINELQEQNDALWSDTKQKEFEKRMQKSDNASAKLGQLLLQGWTMLADHCPKCQTPLMSLKQGNPQCCMCTDESKQSIAAQKQKAKDRFQSLTSITERNEQSVPKQNNSVTQKNANEMGRNGFDAEQKRNEQRYGAMPMNNYGYYGHHPPPPMYGFGPRQDEQLRRTMGDIVKTVLDRMNVINERMSRNNDSLQNDVTELQSLMDFLLNVQKFKSQLRR